MSSHWKMPWRKSILEFLMNSYKLVKIYRKSFKTICSEGVYFSLYAEFLRSKYLAYHLSKKYKHSLSYKLIYVTRTHAFVICRLFSKTFFSIYGYCNLQNFSLTREDKQWKHENVENEQYFWYKFTSIFGVSEDFEALFSARLRKSFCMYLILMLCVFNV